MQPIWNPAQSLVQGLSTAQRIRDSLQRQQMEERQLKLAEEEQSRARQVRNIQLLGEIVRNARGVSPEGTVTESTTIDPRVRGLPGVKQPEPTVVTNRRVADPARAFEFEGRQFEFLSPGDLEERQLEVQRRSGEQQNLQALDRFRGQEAVKDVYKDKDRDLERELAEGRITAQQAIAEARARAEFEQETKRQQFQTQLESMRQGFQAGQGELNRSNARTVAGIRSAGGGGSGAAGATDPLVEAVLANPAAFDNLTPTQKTRIIPALSAAGFGGFGKEMASGDVRKAGEMGAALQGLTDLRNEIKANSRYMGPISGFQAINPYSDARKVRANIDLIRQRVGKALEGGVLRKEDEEKYRAILPTVNDTMETAMHKIGMLEKSLQTDLAAFQSAQRGAGRRVPGGSSTSEGGASIRPGERTATNPQTGERLVLRGGQWVRP